MCICISRLYAIISSDNGLLPIRCHASVVILLIGPLGTYFSEIWIEIQQSLFKKMWLKVLSARWRPLCFSLNELNEYLCYPWGRIWTTWLSIWYCRRCLTIRSRKASKVQDWVPKCSYCFDIWQVPPNHQGACQISERSDNSKYKSPSFEILQVLSIRCIIRYWNRALVCPHDLKHWGPM